MKSIAARLAVWYALAATLTLASLSLAGYFLLQKNLVHGLDLLNTGEFRQIEALLGSGYKSLSPVALGEQIRETTNYASVPFFIDIRGSDGVSLFRSSNLRGQTLTSGSEAAYDIDSADIGPVRAANLTLEPYRVLIATPLKPVRDSLHGYIQVSVALAAITMIISIAIGFCLSHFALRPIHIIEETANRIRSDNLSERIPVDDVDSEVANLAQLLNQMFDRLESSFNQIRRFTGEASHELKTPLSLIRLQAERMIVGGGLNAAHEEAVYAQLEEVARLNKIIDELLLISRAEAGAITLELKSQQPEVFLQSFAQDARVLAEHRGLHYRDRHTGDGVAAFDSQWVRQVLLNLLANAINASPPGGAITVASLLSDTTWRVSVSDEGPGVPEAARTKIFERFVRLGSTGTEGSGLGLAICRSIVELHKGRIWAEAGDEGPDKISRGLRIVFELPFERPLPAVIKNGLDSAGENSALTPPAIAAPR